MTKSSIVTKVLIGLVVFTGVSTGLVMAAELSKKELSTPKDLEGLAAMQAIYEDVRNLGGFTSSELGELAYYYSEKVPKWTNSTNAPYLREVHTALTDCKQVPGFPSSPKFLYGGLDPYSLIERKDRDSRTEDLTYSGFFPARSSNLGTCDNFSVVSIRTGHETKTDYVVLFTSLENKNRFDQEIDKGLAPMPAAGFWCLWGLGGGRPHFAVPNNPQFVVYQLDEEMVDEYGLETSVYIGANYWLRINGMGSPNVLRQLSEYLETFYYDSGIADQVHPRRFKSIIFHDPLE